MYSNEDIEKFVLETGCKLLSASGGTSGEILVECSCGRKFKTTFARYMYKNKRRCDVCSGYKHDRRYVAEYLSKYGAKLLSEEYLRASQKLDIQCSCGNVFHTTFATVVSSGKVKCNVCTIGRKNSSFLTIEEVQKMLQDKKLKLLSTYENTSSKCKLRCRCGKEFYRTMNKVQNGQYLCPSCASTKSKVEILASEYLDSKGVEYVEQYHFKDLKTRNNVYLRFDFAIMNNGNLLCLIELDGSQHYEPVKAWGGDAGLARRKELDKWKDEYCYEHNIKLYRIPYWKFNKINEELENILNMEILCQVS